MKTIDPAVEDATAAADLAQLPEPLRAFHIAHFGGGVGNVYGKYLGLVCRCCNQFIKSGHAQDCPVPALAPPAPMSTANPNITFFTAAGVCTDREIYDALKADINHSGAGDNNFTVSTDELGEFVFEAHEDVTDQSQLPAHVKFALSVLKAVEGKTQEVNFFTMK